MGYFTNSISLGRQQTKQVYCKIAHTLHKILSLVHEKTQPAEL